MIHRTNRRGLLRPERLIPAVVLLAVAIVMAVLFLRQPGGAPSSSAGGISPGATSGQDADAVSASAARAGSGPNSGTAVKAPPAAPTDRIDGVVVAGLQSRPLPGARVTSHRLTDEARANTAEPPPVLTESTSDAEGRFAFPEAPSVEAGPLVWRVEADGHQPALVVVTKASQLKSRIVVRLEPAKDIAGRVVDESGRPIPGATLGEFLPALWATELPFEPVAVPSLFAKSDSDGRFTIRGVACVENRRRLQRQNTPEGPAPLSDECLTPRTFPARAKGYIPAEARGIPGDQDVLVTLARREAGLRGKVLKADGTAAPGIAVTLILVPDASGPPPSVPPLAFQTTRSAADGGYAFPDLRAASYNINATRVEPPGFGGPCAVDVQLTLARDQEAVQDLTFPEAARLRGLFIDRSTREPIAGVKIMPFNALNSPAAVTTGADGRFTVEAYASKTPEGYQPAELAVQLPQPYLVPEKAEAKAPFWFEGTSLKVTGIEPGADVEVELSIPPGLTATGIVEEPDGRPAASIPLVYTFGNVAETIATDAGGAFSFHVLPGSVVQIGVASDQGSAIVQAPAEKAQDLRIRLEAYASIAGRVVNQKKEPVGGATVALQRQEQSSGAALAVRRQVFATTEADGTFLLSGIHPGGVALAVTLPPDSPWTPPAAQPLDVAAAEKRTGIEIVVSEGDFLEGRVVDTGGRPIPNAVLTAFLGREGSKSWNTNQEGLFRIAGLPADQPLAELTASAQGFESQTKRNVSIYDENLEFRLTRRGEAIVEVLRPGGQPAPNFRLQVLRAAPGGGSEIVVDSGPVSAADGRFPLTDLTGGSYRVEAAETTPQGAPADATGSAEFTWPMGEATPVVRVTLSGGLNLEGRVVDSRQNAVGGARVQLLDPPLSLQPEATGPGGPPAVETTTDSGGRFRIARVPAGTYRLIATAEGATSGETKATVGEGAEPVVLVMQAAPRVTGHIVDSKGQAPRLARLFVYQPSNRSNTITRETEDGTFDIQLAAPGLWTVAASIDGTSDGTSRDVELASGETKEVVFDFSARLRLTGSVKVDGADWEGDPGLALREAGGELAILSATGSGGGYEVALPAGRWQLWLQTTTGQLPVGPPMDLAAEPKEQQQDFDIPLAVADLVVDLGAASAMPDGTMLSLWVQPSGGGEIPVVQGFPLDRPAVRLPRLPEGRYQARLTVNGKPAGASNWTALNVGSENHLVLTLEGP